MALLFCFGWLIYRFWFQQLSSAQSKNIDTYEFDEMVKERGWKGWYRADSMIL